MQTPTNTDKIFVNTLLPMEVVKTIDTICVKEDIKRAQFVRRAINQYLEHKT